MDPTVRENINKKLFKNSPKYRNNDEIIKNENLLTWRCNKTTCKMNDVTATPAGIRDYM